MKYLGNKRCDSSGKIFHIWILKDFLILFWLSKKNQKLYKASKLSSEEPNPKTKNLHFYLQQRRVSYSWVLSWVGRTQKSETQYSVILQNSLNKQKNQSDLWKILKSLFFNTEMWIFQDFEKEKILWKQNCESETIK